MFKIGDRVKLKELRVLKHYFGIGRYHLSSGPSGMLRTIERGWYTPTEDDYETLSRVIFTVIDTEEHQVMGTCCILKNGTDMFNTKRFPEGWLENEYNEL